MYKPKTAALSNENGGHTIADLAKGSQLMMDIDKSSYPVTVLKVTSVTGEEFNVLNDNDGMLYLNRTEYMTLIITSNKNIHFEMILDVGIGEKRKETRFLI